MREIGAFISSEGYTEPAMKQHGLTAIPWRGSHVRTLLEYKISEISTLGLLVRLFFFGEAVAGQSVSSILPPTIVDGMLACGMLAWET